VPFFAYAKNRGGELAYLGWAGSPTFVRSIY
jgi:hypothetical protein